MQIAISGPAGAGKGTLARALARTLHIAYVDAGLIFRGIAYAKTQDASRIQYTWDGFEAYLALDGENITPVLKSEEIASITSRLAENIQHLRVMEAMVHAIAAQFPHLVCDGRNAGTTILPDAQFKFYVTADTEVRAMRRMHDLAKQNCVVPYTVILHEITERDRRDCMRASHPFVVPADATIIDTSTSSIEGSIKKMMRVIKESAILPH